MLCLSYCPLARFGVDHERAFEFVVSRMTLFPANSLTCTLPCRATMPSYERSGTTTTPHEGPLSIYRPQGTLHCLRCVQTLPHLEDTTPPARATFRARMCSREQKLRRRGLCLYLQTTRYVLMPTVCPNSHALRRYHPFCKNDLPLTCCFAPMHAREQKFRNKGIMVSYEDSISICTPRGTL